MASDTKDYVGAIDQGTTSTRFILFNSRGELVASHQIPLNNIFPNAGWQEQDPEDLYEGVVACLQGVLDQGYSADQVASIGITNQRETTIAWNRKSGKPYYNSIVWCDTRTEVLAQEWINSSDLGHNRFRAQTGLPVSTYFSALKIQWLIQKIPTFARDLEQCPEEVCIGTVDAWLLWKLCGVFKTDVTNASRTLLFDLKTLTWNHEICSLFGLKTPHLNLPAITHNCDKFGTIQAHLPFGGLEVTGVVGDQQSSLLGFGCLNFGEVKNTYGTGCFLLMNTGPNLIPSQHGLLTTVGMQLGEKNALLKDYQGTVPVGDSGDPYGDVCYALEGSVASCGSLLTWLIESMKIAESPTEICQLALEVDNNADLCIVPAFTGLLAPYWCLDARGIILGLTRYCTNKHLCRAVLESIALQTRDIVESMKHDVIENKRKLAPGIAQHLQLDGPVPEGPISPTDRCEEEFAYEQIIKSLRVDGGVANSSFLCAVQSDVLNIPVMRAIMQERTALGAAIASGLGSGFFANVEEVHKNIWSGACDASIQGDEYTKIDCPQKYKPDGQGDGFFKYLPNVDARHDNLPKFIRKWAVAIEKSKGWASIE